MLVGTTLQCAACSNVYLFREWGKSLFVDVKNDDTLSFSHSESACDFIER